MYTLLFLGLGLLGLGITNLLVAGKYVTDAKKERLNQHRFGLISLGVGLVILAYNVYDRFN